jgi:DNA invertase Pin-like site-specific DNA recombinase
MLSQQIGYARAIIKGDDLERQREALVAAGCSELFEDRGTRARALRRPGLKKALAALQKGDQLVVYKLDCIGWSLGYLVRLLIVLAQRGIGFRSLQDGLDTNDKHGPFLLHLMRAFAEFERSIWTEHTRVGLAVAEEKGRRPGRPMSMDRNTLRRARKLLEQGKTQQEVAAIVGVSRATLNRRVGPTRRLLMLREDASQRLDKLRRRQDDMA